MGSSDSTTTFGSSTNLWGLTWTVSQANSIEVQVQARCSGGSNQNANVLDLDYLTLTLYYTAPASTTTTSLCSSGSDILPSLSGTNTSALAGAPLLLSTVAGLFGKRNRSRAVAPVVATILLIAVAVAISVIAFFWSQGFLSNTSSSTGSQQAAQNQAAQSSIAIELATFVTGGADRTNTPTTCSATTANHFKITLVARNVGAVAIGLGSLTITGLTSNSGFQGSITISSFVAATDTAVTTYTDSGITNTGIHYYSATASSIAKGNSTTIYVCNVSTSGALSKNVIASGDVMNLKLTTTVGTFAQSQFTVP